MKEIQETNEITVVPVSKWARCGLINFCGLAIYHTSLSYISFPAGALSKSCKLLSSKNQIVGLFSMIGRVQIYTNFDYFSVFLITIGQIGFNYRTVKIKRY